MKFDAKFSQPRTVLKPSFGGTIYTVPGSGSCVDCVKSVNGVLPDADGNVTIHESSSSEEITQVLAKAVPRVTTVILDADKWVENGAYYSQTLELDNVTQYSRLDLQPDATMIEDMRTLGVIFVTENTNGKITVQSIGNKPSKTYIIQATIVEIKPEIEPDRILGMPVGTAKNTEEAISPKISVNKEDKITTLTITDIEGTKTVMINDGADGKSGVHVGEEEPTGNEVVWIDTDGEPDVLVKTVNGQKPDEDGNVEIEVSGEEVDLTGYATEKYVDDAVAAISHDIPRVEISEAAATLEPNKFYVFPEMASLAITLGGVVNTSIVQEYKFRFTSGATATTLTLPDTVKGDITVDANSVVEISIVDGYAVSQSWAV